MDEEGAGTRVAVVITPVTSAIGVNLEVHPTPVGQLQELLPWFRLLHLCGGKLAHTGLLVSLWLCDGIKIGGSGNTAPSNDKYDGMGSDGLEAIRQGINKKGPIFMALWTILEAIGLRIGRCERIRTSDPFLPKEVRYQAAPHTELRSGNIANWSDGANEFSAILRSPPGVRVS